MLTLVGGELESGKELDGFGGGSTEFSVTTEGGLVFSGRLASVGLTMMTLGVRGSGGGDFGGGGGAGMLPSPHDVEVRTVIAREGLAIGGMLGGEGGCVFVGKKG